MVSWVDANIGGCDSVRPKRRRGKTRIRVPISAFGRAEGDNENLEIGLHIPREHGVGYIA